jgi:hypothetical protein
MKVLKEFLNNPKNLPKEIQSARTMKAHQKSCGTVYGFRSFLLDRIFERCWSELGRYERSILLCSERDSDYNAPFPIVAQLLEN